VLALGQLLTCVLTWAVSPTTLRGKEGDFSPQLYKPGDYLSEYWLSQYLEGSEESFRPCRLIDMKEYHIPVLLKEIVEYLDPRPSDVIVDATFGFGGHSKLLLRKIGKSGRLIAIEQDKTILELAQKQFNDSRITFINENFLFLKSILKNCNVKKVDKILFDLGISSYHFGKLGLGFSFDDNNLDMRLDRETGITAKKLVNSMSEKNLADMLYQNADEYRSRKIAKAIVESRRIKKIDTAKQLSEIIARNVPKHSRVNPATKTFQALRIAVNSELDNLQEVLPEAIEKLNANGRLAVISFHSKEDKIVKETFKDFQNKKVIEILTKKPLVAEYEEIKHNPRSRSAKLRVAKKIN